MKKTKLFIGSLLLAFLIILAIPMTTTTAATMPAAFASSALSATSSSSSSSTVTHTFSGRAYGALVQTPLTGTRTFVDTGPLPATGGHICKGPTTIKFVTLLSAKVLSACTTGKDGVALSNTTVTSIAIVVAGVPITATAASATAKSTCSGADGTATVLRLKIGGILQSVSGLPNQFIQIKNVNGKVIGNVTVFEEATNPHQANSVIVNALDIRTQAGIKIIIAHASSDIACTTTSSPTASSASSSSPLALSTTASFFFTSGPIVYFNSLANIVRSGRLA